MHTTSSSPVVSILVPTYNRSRLLGEALASIVNQDFKNFEVLVVDNCSTDDTAVVVAGFNDDRIVYVRNEVNVGAVNNHNRALRIARGEFIYFFSDDDVMLPHNLTRKVEILKQNPSVGLVHSSINTIDGSGTLVSPGHWAPGYLQDIMVSQPLMTQAAAFELLYYRWNFVAMPTVLVRGEVLRQNRLEFSNQLKHLCDWDLWMKISLVADFYYLDEILVSYRMHSTNDSHLLTSKVLYRELCLSKLGMLHLFNKHDLHGRDYMAEVDKLVIKQLKSVSKYESYFQEKALPLRTYLKSRFSATVVERLRKLRYLKFGR